MTFLGRVQPPKPDNIYSIVRTRYFALLPQPFPLSQRTRSNDDHPERPQHAQNLYPRASPYAGGINMKRLPSLIFAFLLIALVAQAAEPLTLTES